MPFADSPSGDADAHAPHDAVCPAHGGGAGVPPHIQDRLSLKDQVCAVVGDVRAVVEARLALVRIDLGARATHAKQGVALIAVAAVLGLALINAAVIGAVFWLAAATGLGWALLITLSVLAGIIFALMKLGAGLLARAFANPVMAGSSSAPSSADDATAHPAAPQHPASSSSTLRNPSEFPDA